MNLMHLEHDLAVASVGCPNGPSFHDVLQAENQRFMDESQALQRLHYSLVQENPARILDTVVLLRVKLSFDAPTLDRKRLSSPL